ncbi:MAG: hypothetical protein L0G46_07985 [Kocuria sp.]|nr:hypothetical protein [Kocuria sp.]
MDDRGSRARAHGALAALRLPEPFRLGDVVEAVEHERCTRIQIIEFPDIAAEDGLFGIWLNTDDLGDFILHVPTESELHRVQVILHELSHMILGHDLSAGQSSAAQLFPDISEETVMRVLARGHEDDALEHEAETLADLIASSMRRSNQNSSFAKVFG